jgi:glycosyltransferase involved in cell wall biosynthesis
VRVAVNVEQLLFRAPGGTGRYTARLVALLPQLTPGDTVIPFCARHTAAEVTTAYRFFGLDQDRVPEPVRLALPRPVLYEAWHHLGLPPLDWGSADLAGADLVHAPSPAVPPRGSRPLVVTVHDAAFELFPEAFPRRGRLFHRQGVKMAARRADLIITATEASAREIVERTPVTPDRLRVVPHGVDHVEAPPEDVAATLERFGLDDAPYVLWVGSMEPRKGVGTLVAAFARQATAGGRGDGPPHRLVLVGPAGWLDGGQIDSADVGRLGDRLRMLGSVDEGSLRSLYAGADLFAFPSWHEGFGLPVLEAMVQGTAVLCSDVPALHEVAGGAAHLVPPGDVEAWAAALAELLADPGRRAALADAGRIRAWDFTWEQTIVGTRAVYAEALG